MTKSRWGYIIAVSVTLTKFLLIRLSSIWIIVLVFCCCLSIVSVTEFKYKNNICMIYTTLTRRSYCWGLFEGTIAAFGNWGILTNSKLRHCKLVLQVQTILILVVFVKSLDDASVTFLISGLLLMFPPVPIFARRCTPHIYSKTANMYSSVYLLRILQNFTTLLRHKWYSHK